VLNYLSTMPWRHTEEWRYSSTILDLGTRWRWVVSYTHRPLYLWGKSPRFLLDRRLGGLQSRSELCGGDTNLELLGIESGPSSPAHLKISAVLFHLLWWRRRIIASQRRKTLPAGNTNMLTQGLFFRRVAYTRRDVPLLAEWSTTSNVVATVQLTVFVLMNAVVFSGFHLSGVVSTPRSSSPTSSAYSLEPDKKYKVSVSFDRWVGWVIAWGDSHCEGAQLKSRVWDIKFSYSSLQLGRGLLG
jgi:hypothetical protein